MGEGVILGIVVYQYELIMILYLKMHDARRRRLVCCCHWFARVPKVLCMTYIDTVVTSVGTTSKLSSLARGGDARRGISPLIGSGQTRIAREQRPYFCLQQQYTIPGIYLVSSM